MPRSLLLLLACASSVLAERPLMKDFIGEESPVVLNQLMAFVPVTQVLTTYPEDPAAGFAESIRAADRWRSQHVTMKSLWIAQSLPSTTDKPLPSGADLAMWVVRSHLLLAAVDVERTHLTLQLTDKEKPRGALTAQALTWLRKAMGDYRFFRIDREDAKDSYAYEFIHGSDHKKRIWVVWKPEGEPHITRLYNDPLRIIRAERMPVTTGEPEEVTVKQEIEGYMAVEAGPRPVLIWLEGGGERKKEEGKK